MKKRLDVLTTEKGLFDSREKAKTSIMAGLVLVDGQVIDKPGTSVDEESEISLKEVLCPYVSRGGLKLEKALDTWNFSLQGAKAVDIGASTGGFTDCMLQRGASRVYCIDVGYGQLDWKLRNDPRVVVMERTNARNMEPDWFTEAPDFASMDVSFISVKLILPGIYKSLREGAQAVILVKPQFEAGRGRVGKNGVVRDKDTHRQVVEDTARFALDTGFSIRQIDYSPITGPKGNIEFLLLLEKSGTAGGTEVLADIPHIVDMAHGELA